MSDSLNIITAQISFLDTNLSLIHIPIDHYSFFFQPILRLLFGEDHDEDAAKIPWTDRHKFLNISITPVECSVFCSRELADRFFRPLADLFNKCMRSKNDGTTKDDVIEIIPEDFVVVRVDGGGIEAGQRVLELTSPLAMAGISIFFVTTYFSDYILVPARAHHTVTQALQQRGFVFSKSADAFVSQLSPSSPTSAHARRPQQHHGHAGSSVEESSSGKSTTTSTAQQQPPQTPPARSVSELQTRTFARLRNNNIVPAVDRSLRLMSCAGHKDSQSDGVLEAQLRDDLLQVLLATAPGCVPLEVSNSSSTHNKETSRPSAGLGVERLTIKDDDDDDDDEKDHPPDDFSTRFLSLTLTDTEPISVLLEHRLLFLTTTTTTTTTTPAARRTGFGLGRSLLGSRGADDVLVPITLDLRDLPLEATGIVCGVAGRLAEPSTLGEREGEDEPSVEASRGEGEVPSGGGSGSPGGGGGGAGEISFLSTARAGTVIVRESELDRAVQALGLDLQ